MEYIGHMKGITDQLAVIGNAISNKEIVQQLINGLGSNFDMLTTGLQCLPLLPSFEYLQEKVLQHESTMTQRQMLSQRIHIQCLLQRPPQDMDEEMEGIKCITVPVGATQARAHHGRPTAERPPPWWPITVWIHFIRCSGRALIHGCVNSKERYSTFPRTPRLGRREPTLHAQHTTVPWGLAPPALRTGETSGKTKRGRLPIT
ncbi:hypothetical protein EJ110_NYTH27598 [Nymphaea thermarum]|nr:hypothetical protein EJ110_NYTH27598 [Nymphaea thermarum]